MEPQTKILHTALDLFYKYGIKRVTMDDIARELGMSKKTIYQYYKEKDDLVNQLCEAEMQKHEHKFETVHQQANDSVHEMLLISKHMQEMMNNINPLFFMDLQKFYPEALKRYKQFKDGCATIQIKRNIAKGIELGVYRSSIDSDFAAKYRLMQIDAVMFGSYFSFDKFSFTQTHQLILDMFLHGLCTLKGHKLINKYKEIQEEE